MNSLDCAQNVRSRQGLEVKCGMCGFSAIVEGILSRSISHLVAVGP